MSVLGTRVEGTATRGRPLRARAVVRVLRSFGRFWWDFLVGDTPELFVGVLVALGAVLALRGAPAVQGGVLLGAAVALLAGSTWRGRARG
jgi:hypothetical protein